MTSSNMDSVLELARRIESTAIDAFEGRRFQPNAAPDILVMTMAVRCLALFQGVICCAKDALADAAMVTARSLLEQRFVILAIVRSADDAERSKRLALLAAQAEFDRARVFKKLKNLPASERDEQVTDQWLAEAEARLGIDRKKTSAETWARWAGLHGLYLTAYASLSLHVHPSYLALDLMMRRDVNDELLISAKPHQDALPMTVLLATEAMVDALAALPEGFVSPEEVSAIALHGKSIEGLLKGMPSLDLTMES
jgi:hypothetical protein